MAIRIFIVHRLCGLALALCFSVPADASASIVARNDDGEPSCSSAVEASGLLVRAGQDPALVAPATAIKYRGDAHPTFSSSVPWNTLFQSPNGGRWANR